MALSTIDGASNGLKAMRLAKIPFFIGGAHNLARALKYGTGEAGTVSSNPDMKRLMEQAYALAAKQRSSAKLTLLYEEAQGNMCAAAKKLKLPGLCRTRWTGGPKLAKALNVNEGPTRLVYTSFGPGDGDEHEDDGFESSYDVASDDDSEMAVAMRWKADASIIPSQEQYKDLRHFEGVMAPAMMVTKQFEVSPRKVTAQQVVPLLCYLVFVYDPKTRHLFRCPMRTKKYQGNGNRTWEMVPHRDLTKANKVLVKVVCAQLKTRFAEIPDVFLLAAATNPYADLEKSFRGNANLIARAKAIYKASLRTVLKNMVRTEFEALDKAAAKAKVTEKVAKLVAKKAVSDMPDCYYDMIYGGHAGAIDGDEIEDDEDDNALGESIDARIRAEVEKRMLSETTNFKSLSRATAHTGDDIIAFFGKNYSIITAHAIAWQSCAGAKGGQCCVEQVFSACGLTMTNGQCLLLLIPLV